MSSSIYRRDYRAEVLEARCLLSAGDLDTSFGVGGYALPQDQTHDYTIANVLVTSDGKTIAAGSRETKRNSHDHRQMYLEEFNSNGSLNTAFGNDGIAAISMTSDVVMQKALLQTDGKIVVVGETVTGIGVVRFNPDGTLDHSFNQTGQLEFGFSGRDSALTDAAIAPGNQLIVVGNVPSKSGQFDKPAIAKLNINGSFDTGFADSGQLIFGSAAHYGVTVRADGRILLAGTNPSDQLAFAQFHSDGTIDAKFANDGFGAYDMGHQTFFQRHQQPVLTLLTNGDLLFGGTVQHNDDVVRGVILAVTTKGKIDKTFGAGGHAIFKNGITAIAASTKQIYVAAAGQMIYRLSLSGLLSPSFGTAGATRVALPGVDNFAPLAALSIAGGFISIGVTLGDPSASAIVRLMPDGTSSTSFGTNGITNLQTPGTEGAFDHVTATPDGKIIVAGETADIADGTSPMLEELNNDGSRNSAFGDNGVMLLNPTVDGADPKSVVVDPNSGKIYVGFTNNDSAIIVRLTADGALDATWGSGGKVTLNWFSSASSTLNSLLLQPDGKLLVAGSTVPTHTTDIDFAIARFNSDGTPDTSFDQDGRVTTSLGTGTGDNTLARTLLYPDGQILLVGTREQTTNSKDSDLALIRYNNDGSIDTTFGSGGKVFTNTTLNDDDGNGPFRAQDTAVDALILSNGQIVVADDANALVGLGLLLYNADGSLNQSYQNSLSVGNRIALTANDFIVTLNPQNDDISDVGRDTSHLTEDADFGSLTGTGDALSVDGNGKILIAGSDGVSPFIARLQGS